MITWGHPQAAWLILVWAVLAFACIFFYRRGRRIRARLADEGLWPALAPGHQPRHGARRLALWIAASGLVLCAFARPQYGFRWEEVRQEGVDWMIVLDVSNSMLAPDFKPSRMQQAGIAAAAGAAGAAAPAAAAPKAPADAKVASMRQALAAADGGRDGGKSTGACSQHLGLHLRCR